MKTLILILSFSFAAGYGYAQEKSFTLDEVQHADKVNVLKGAGKIVVDSAKQSNRKIKRNGKSGKELTEQVVSTADTLSKLKTQAEKLKALDKKDLKALDVKDLKSLDAKGISSDKIEKIYSEKHLKFAYDSMLANLNWNAINQLIQNPQSLSEQNLLNAMVAKFPSLQKVTKAQQDATALSAIASGGDPYRTISSLAALNMQNFSKNQAPDSLLPKLPDSVVSKLPRIPGGQSKAGYLKLNEKYLHWLDSVRGKNLKEDGLALSEEKISENEKVARIKKRLSFLDKIYFEGIVGVFSGTKNDKFNLFQFSPSLGYHITKFFSLGLGPNILVQESQKKLTLEMGLRTFAKLEFFDRKLYAQLEDQMNFPNKSQSNFEDRISNAQHSVLAGGGILFPLTSRLFFNLSILRRVTGSNTAGSPWVFRVGLSSRKAKQ